MINVAATALEEWCLVVHAASSSVEDAVRQGEELVHIDDHRHEQAHESLRTNTTGKVAVNRCRFEGSYALGPWRGGVFCGRDKPGARAAVQAVTHREDSSYCLIR